MVSKGINFVEDITIQWQREHDEDSEGKPLCSDGKKIAALDPETGRLIICDIAFRLKTISSLKDPMQETCKWFQSRQVNSFFSVLGWTLVHEYTHFNALTSRHLNGKEAADPAYGYYNVQQLRITKPRETSLNADSYDCFAEEFFWTKYCKRLTAVPMMRPLYRKPDDSHPPDPEPNYINLELKNDGYVKYRYQNYMRVMTFTLKKFSSAINELEGRSPWTNRKPNRDSH